MSQGPWKINERSFLYQITFIYYTLFLFKTQTPHWSLGPGLERCAAGIGVFLSFNAQKGEGEGWAYKTAQVSEPLGKGSALGRWQLWASVELPRGQEQLLHLSKPWFPLL